MEGNCVNRNTQREDNLGFEEHRWGTSWPARNYVCSFCKREFRSAQALGGHMNVHRRDRARLRSSLFSDQCPKPNPTTTTTTLISPSSPTLLNCAQHSSKLCSPNCLTLSSSSPSPASTNEDKKPRLTLSLPLLSPQRREIMKCYEEEEKKDINVYKNNEQNVNLELGIGMLKHQEEKLDLELRL